MTDLCCVLSLCSLARRCLTSPLLPKSARRPTSSSSSVHHWQSINSLLMVAILVFYTDFFKGIFILVLISYSHFFLERTPSLTVSGTPCPARLHAIPTHSQTDSAKDGASGGCNKDMASFRRKLVGRNCMDAISTHFPGFRFRSSLLTSLRWPASPLFQSGLGWWARTGF